jgi:hypothetical protein
VQCLLQKLGPFRTADLFDWVFASTIMIVARENPSQRATRWRAMGQNLTL